MNPLLSIVIVSYHSREDLERCLPSIEGQDVERCEVVVVDNAPGDGTSVWLQFSYPWVKVIENSENTGYAGGNNVGVRRASGEYVLILNPDTELRAGALSALLAAVRAHPDALVTAKLLNPDGTVNACGNQMHVTGITTCRGLGLSQEGFLGVHPVPLVSGAAFIARRALLLELGGFQADFFMYLEDTELSLRARSRGYRVLCAAEAEIVHHYSLGMTAAKLGHLERNRWRTVLMHLETRTLWRLLPAFVLTELATWAFALLRGPAFLVAKVRSYSSLWRERAKIRVIRAEAQSLRTVGDEELLSGSTVTLPFDQLVGNPILSRVLERITAPLYRATALAVRPHVEA